MSAAILATVCRTVVGAHALAHAEPGQQPREAVTAPVASLFGNHPGFSFAARGVNTATGNLVVHADDLAAPIPFGRTYNSRDTHGWSVGYSARLEPAGGAVTFVEDDGRASVFTPTSAGYQRPPGLDADLEDLPGGGYRVHWFTGDVWTFTATGLPLTRDDRGNGGDLLTLALDPAGHTTGVTDTVGDRLDLTYAAGLLQRATTGDGRSVTYTYDAQGHLAGVNGPSGDVSYTYTDGELTRAGDPATTNTYDAQGRVTGQSAPGTASVTFAYDTPAPGVTTVTDTVTGAAVRYTHDAAGRPTRVEGGPGELLTARYDAAERLVESTTPGGFTTTTTYDPRGNLLRREVNGQATAAFAYDALDRVTSATDAAGTVRTFAYTGDGRIPTTDTGPLGAVTQRTVADGLVTSETDPSGAVTQFAYDRRQLAAVTDPMGGITRYTRDAVGRIDSVTSPLGLTTRRTYDADGNVLTETSASGAVTTHHYSPAGRLLDTTDPTGAVTAHHYDDADRPTADVDALDRTRSYAYGPDGRLATLTEPGGAASTVTYTPQGNVATVTSPTGASISHGYDAAGRATTVTDPSGTTTTTYDAQGNVVAVTDPMGRTTRYTYDAAGNQITRTDPLGAVWHAGYDAAGHLVTDTTPLGDTTRYTYDTAGRLTSTTDPLGGVVRRAYDAAGHLTTLTDADGGVTRYTYDADGRRASETTPAGLTTRHAYDKDGHETATTDPRGGVTRTVYNARGEVTETTSPGGSVRHFVYDASGALLSATDADGAVTHYAYDGSGNLATLTDAKGAVTSFSYDANGRQTSHTDPLGRVTHRTYDASGDLVSVTDPAGRTMRMEYDADRELTRRAGADGSTVDIAYDADGRRVRMTDPTGATAYAYDPDDRMTSVTEPGDGVFTLTYDAASRRTALAYPDGDVLAYSFDPAGRMTAVDDPRSGTAAYTLDGDGRIVGEQLPALLARHYAYDGGLLTDYQQTRGTQRTIDTHLTRDPDGRVVAELDRVLGKGPRDMRYDADGQLLDATGGGLAPLHAAYDAVGNRTVIGRGASTTALTYDAADELTSSDETFAARTTHTSYGYDPAGRLTVTDGPGEHVDTAYDGFGRAATTTRATPDAVESWITAYRGDDLPTHVAASRTYTRGSFANRTWTRAVDYGWSGDDAVPQILTQRETLDPVPPVGGRGAQDPGLDEDADFVYGQDRVFADSVGPGHHPGPAVFTHDAYGSDVRTSGPSGTEPWVQAAAYDELGAPRDNDIDTRVLWPPVPRFGYRGESSLDTDVFMRARTYDTTTGRFTSRDPVDVRAGQTAPLSPYNYADNDPLDRVDPLGTWSFSDAFSLLASLFFGWSTGSGVPYAHCPPYSDDIGGHTKCFHNVVLTTRGWNYPADCLKAEPGCLNDMWNSRKYEAAAVNFTIHHVSNQRTSLWDEFFGPDVQHDVDWEVRPGPFSDPLDYFQVDIMTDETNAFEAKRWTGPATDVNVQTQLGGYIATLNLYWNVPAVRGTELGDWADEFHVWGNLWEKVFGGTTVYVWGAGNPAGHVYFATDDDAPERIRSKLWWTDHGFGSDSPGVPIAPPIPIPLVPVA